MKTAVIASCFLLGGSVLMKQPATENRHTISIASVKSNKSKRVNDLSKPVGAVRIVVDKSEYQLYVYDSKGWFATYPVVFGNSSLEDKRMEGDRLTPEGTFTIANKRVHEKWARYMGLNYPTSESLAKFKARKQRGEIPSSATPGGGVGIHGTWPHEDFVIDRYNNWTNGCVSLKNEDVLDLYSYVPVGTSVTIRK